MPTLTNTKTRNLKYLSHLLWEYSFYLRQELRNSMVYLTSLLIGFLVTWLMQTPSMIPLLMSWIVLIAANAIQQFKNSGYDWYGEDIWGVFEKHHLHFRDVFERMRN